MSVFTWSGDHKAPALSTVSDIVAESELSAGRQRPGDMDGSKWHYCAKGFNRSADAHEPSKALQSPEGVEKLKEIYLDGNLVEMSTESIKAMGKQHLPGMIPFLSL